MKKLVIDASVAAAAIFREEHADRAKALLAGGAAELYAPDFIMVELASVIWKRHRRGEILHDEAIDLLADLASLPFIMTPATDLVTAALELALRLGCTVYDCLYLALAVREQAVMITSDERLARTMASSPLRKHIATLSAEVGS